MNKVEEVIFLIDCVSNGRLDNWSDHRKAQRVWNEVNPRNLLRNVQTSLNGGVIREFEHGPFSRTVELQDIPLPSDLPPSGIPPRREISSEEPGYKVIENNVVIYEAGEIGIIAFGYKAAEVYVRRPWKNHIIPPKILDESDPRIILNLEDGGFKTRLQESLAQVARRRICRVVTTNYEINDVHRFGGFHYREQDPRSYLRALHPNQAYHEWIEIKK